MIWEISLWPSEHKHLDLYINILILKKKKKRERSFKEEEKSSGNLEKDEKLKKVHC